MLFGVSGLLLLLLKGFLIRRALGPPGMASNRKRKNEAKTAAEVMT